MEIKKIGKERAKELKQEKMSRLNLLYIKQIYYANKIKLGQNEMLKELLLINKTN